MHGPSIGSVAVIVLVKDSPSQTLTATWVTPTCAYDWVPHHPHCHAPHASRLRQEGPRRRQRHRLRRPRHPATPPAPRRRRRRRPNRAALPLRMPSRPPPLSHSLIRNTAPHATLRNTATVTRTPRAALDTTPNVAHQRCPTHRLREPPHHLISGRAAFLGLPRRRDAEGVLEGSAQEGGGEGREGQGVGVSSDRAGARDTLPATVGLAGGGADGAGGVRIGVFDIGARVAGLDRGDVDVAEGVGAELAVGGDGGGGGGGEDVGEGLRGRGRVREGVRDWVGVESVGMGWVAIGAYVSDGLELTRLVTTAGMRLPVNARPLSNPHTTHPSTLAITSMHVPC